MWEIRDESFWVRTGTVSGMGRVSWVESRDRNWGWVRMEGFEVEVKDCLFWL